MTVRIVISIIYLTILIANLAISSYALSCKDDEVLAQKQHKRPQSNGCSKPAGIQIAGEEDFTYCCDRHDTCYAMCGASKDQCENDFGKCLKRMCKTNFSSNKQCSQAAEMYTMGTTMFGGNGFETSQEEFCTCIPKNDKLNHYALLIDDFYHRFTKPGDQKKPGLELVNDELIEKKKPFWELYYNLFKKYDNAIAHDARRKKMNPPRPPEKIKQKEESSQSTPTESSPSTSVQAADADSSTGGDTTTSATTTTASKGEL